MTFDNTKNSLSLCYYIRQVNGVVSKAKAIAKAQELESRLHELMKENKELKLKLSLKK